MVIFVSLAKSSKEVAAHYQWYEKYLEKEQSKKMALRRWRENKEKLKKKEKVRWINYNFNFSIAYF